MKINDYQPIQFSNEGGLCQCNSKESMLAQTGDTTTFQAEMEICPAVVNLIENGTFASPQSTGWAGEFGFTSFKATSPVGTSQELITAKSVMGINLAYQLEVDILTNVGTPLLVYFGTKVIAEITNTGKFKLSGICESNTTDGTLKFLSGVGNSITIERVALYPLESDIGLTIQTLASDGQFSHVHFRTLAEDIADANYTFFKVDRDVITINFDWDYITDGVNGLGLEFGCYRLGLVGECVNWGSVLGLYDPEFNMPSAVSTKEFLGATSFPYTCDVEASVKVLDGQLSRLNYVANLTTVKQTIPLVPTPGIAYNFELKIDFFGGGLGYVEIAFGSDVSAQYTTTGTKNFILSSLMSVAELEIRLYDPANDGIKIDYCRITSSPTYVEPDVVSNVFSFEAEHVCTKLIHAINSQDAFGLRFEDSMYVPRVRLKGQLRANNFDSKVESHIDGFNIKHIDYFEQRKTRNLQLQNIPEFLIDWFSLFRGFSSVFVDSEEMVVESDADIDWNRFCDRAKIEIEVGDKRQDLVNTRSKGKTAVNTINNFLVRVRDQQEEIIFIDGEQIELKG